MFRRAVDLRVEEVRREYREKAERVDRLLGEEGRGRVRKRLEEFGEIVGLVAGVFNEHSSDTLMLLDVMATSRVDKVARATGLTSPQQAVEKGRVQGELRVQLSLSSLRASMACILDRSHQIGDTAGLCAKRRDAVVQVEVAMREQREAQHLARVRGGPLLCRDHIIPVFRP